jgi:hypothetical protein
VDDEYNRISEIPKTVAETTLRTSPADNAHMTGSATTLKTTPAAWVTRLATSSRWESHKCERSVAL